MNKLWIALTYAGMPDVDDPLTFMLMFKVVFSWKDEKCVASPSKLRLFSSIFDCDVNSTVENNDGLTGKDVPWFVCKFGR